MWFHSSGLKKTLHRDGEAQGQDYCSSSVLATLKSKAAAFVTLLLFSKEGLVQESTKNWHIHKAGLNYYSSPI